MKKDEMIYIWGVSNIDSHHRHLVTALLIMTIGVAHNMKGLIIIGGLFLVWSAYKMVSSAEELIKNQSGKEKT